jgi:pyrroline-5-carboxylate reductase
MNNIIIIGAGNMGKALAKGFLRDKNNHVYFKVKSVNAQQDMISERITYSESYDDLTHLNEPFVFCAVKPASLLNVLSDAKEYFAKIKPKAIISVAAGVRYTDICKVIDNKIPVIRSMPNTPVSYGKGIVGFFGEDSAINQQFKEVCSCLGLVTELTDEKEFNLFTALAGSGPAFVFHFTEALAIAAEKLGMEAHHAQSIATKLIHGAAHMLEEANPRTLREQVTSPNGTTYAGLQNLINANLDIQDSHLTQLLYNTLDAAQKRSKHMAGTFDE